MKQLIASKELRNWIFSLTASSLSKARIQAEKCLANQSLGSDRHEAELNSYHEIQSLCQEAQQLFDALQALQGRVSVSSGELAQEVAAAIKQAEQQIEQTKALGFELEDEGVLLTVLRKCLAVLDGYRGGWISIAEPPERGERFIAWLPDQNRWALFTRPRPMLKNPTKADYEKADAHFRKMVEAYNITEWTVPPPIEDK